MKRIVLIAGFETFNADLYRKAAHRAIERCPQLQVTTFTDRDITEQPDRVAAALAEADVFFASLIFDYEQVLWLRDRVQHIPIRLVFESALELISLTQIGAFKIGDKPSGMPKPVKFILSKFSSGREEDRLAGYLSFLKTGPKLLKFVPIQKVQDLRNWLIIYGYWNAGGLENVAAMLWILAEKYLDLSIGEIAPPIETPNMGLLHPEYAGYFLNPQDYLNWYRQQRSPQLSEPPINQPDHLDHSGRSTMEGSKIAHDRPVVAILLYRKHVVTQQAYIPQLIRHFEAAGLLPLPIFINGVEAHVIVRDWLTTSHEQQQRAQGDRELKSLAAAAVLVDAIVSTIGFPLVGGPAGSMEAGRQVAVAQRILAAKNVPYLVAAPLLIQDLKSWTRQGIGGLQSVVLYALPELDGAIDTVPLGGLVGDDIYLIPERVQRLTSRVKNWIQLRKTPPRDRKLAIILYGFPPGYGATGTAALLNVPRSLLKLLESLQAQGYDVGELPTDGEAIIQQVKAADDRWSLGHPSRSHPHQAPLNDGWVPAQILDQWLGYLGSSRIQKQWGGLTESGIKTFGDELHIGGVYFGNVWIGVQPPLGLQGDPMRLMFERDLTPHPQYAAFYQWLQRVWQPHAIVHFGMHGTVEWLPGSPLGNTGYSWSDILLGNLPHLYIYAANNPSESILAKRRGYGVLISHNVPPYGRAGLYKELVNLRDLIAEYREDPQANTALRDAIAQRLIDTGLDRDCPLPEAQQLGVELSAETLKLFGPDLLDRYFARVYQYLQELEQRLFSSGLHVLGAAPNAEQLLSYLEAYFEANLPRSVLEAIAQGSDLDRPLNAYRYWFQQEYPNRSFELDPKVSERIQEAIRLRDLLNQNTDELTNLLRGLNGEYIPPAPGGDLLRDGPGALPTGRNIHALDPYRMPSPGAYERGKAIARQLIAQHQQEHGQEPDSYPETIAVMLWGLDAIKTKGESLGILLELVGAEPVKEGTGRIVRYELIPLAQLGRPRIDVLANLSGIFRDSFANILELLDDLFARAAAADEPIEQNFIRKHALELQAQGVENPSARLFSNPAGDFGSLVNDRVNDGNWESGDELAQTWRSRNAFSYGRRDRGQARPEVLDRLLATTGRIVQEIDSVEYGLTDIQEYYANTGALKRAAEQQQQRPVTASFVESFGKNTQPRDLNSLLRLEYRTKLLNPKWAEAMAAQGSGGAFEISQRMTALLGWSGTTDFADRWVYDGAAETYALDRAMADRLRRANPEAFRNIVGRLLEANGRGFWAADESVVGQLQALYDETDAALEGVTNP